VLNRDDKLDLVNAKLERNLVLVGSTAIEDKLQEEVPETIIALKEIGVKVWVLTGDKVETAINIGYSAGLLNNDMVQHQVDSIEVSEIMTMLRNINSELNKANAGQKQALIIAGDSLTKMESSSEYLDLFLDISDKVDVVLACRVSPKQKGDIVSMIQARFPKKITLSIGDGANDVAMIMKAHVGVGIAGREGMQAARTADFAMGKFKYLRPLLFAHGREAYRRNSDIVLYSFYKNVLYVIVQF